MSVSFGRGALLAGRGQRRAMRAATASRATRPGGLFTVSAAIALTVQTHVEQDSIAEPRDPSDLCLDRGELELGVAAEDRQPRNVAQARPDDARRRP
jgi:hypothetical protein